MECHTEVYKEHSYFITRDISQGGAANAISEGQTFVQKMTFDDNFRQGAFSPEFQYCLFVQPVSEKKNFAGPISPLFWQPLTKGS